MDALYFSVHTQAQNTQKTIPKQLCSVMPIQLQIPLQSQIPTHHRDKNAINIMDDIMAARKEELYHLIKTGYSCEQ